MNSTENAVSAKVHAIFAKNLKNADYENMLNFHTEEELFNYLHNETAYGEVLETLPSVKLSRSRFESVLRKISLDRGATICKFQKLIGDKSYKYLINKDEIDTIIYCARHLDTPLITNLFQRPSIYQKEQCISGEELQKATSFEEFLQMLEQTPYKRSLTSLSNLENDLSFLPALEQILYNRLYSETEKIVKRNYHGHEQKEILDYIKLLSDMKTISSAYRILDNYTGNSNYKTNPFISQVTAFTPMQIEKIVSATSTSDILSAVKSSVYGKYFNDKISNIDLFVRNLIIDISVHNIHFSQNPILVVLSYETFEKNEIQNIIHIIEGIKYGLSRDELSGIIVKGGC